MPIHERRQHFRVEDKLSFNYKIIKNGDIYTDQSIARELLGAQSYYLETTQYFNSIDTELMELTKTIGLQEPALAHYMNLMNAKIDHVMRHLLLNNNRHLYQVNISLGGMSFQTKNRIKEETRMKLMMYIRPKMFPLFVDAVVVYSQFHDEDYYRTAVQFENLTPDDEYLLSQHITLAQRTTTDD